MIFFAVAGPTPGSASSCAWVAVLRSTGPADGAALARAATAGAAASRASMRRVTQDSRPALFNLNDIVISPFPGHDKRIRTHSNRSIIALPGNTGEHGRTQTNTDCLLSLIVRALL